MKNEIVKFNTPELDLIEPSKAQQIRSAFEPMVKMLEEFEDSYNKILKESKKEITEDITGRAKRLRLDIGKIRNNTETLRKAKKEESLREGKAIDAVSNTLKWAVMDKENKLKEIEDHFEILEKERIDTIQKERTEILEKLGIDIIPDDLGTMADLIWNNYLAGVKLNYETRKEAERKAEEQRLEEMRIDMLYKERKESILSLWQFIPEENRNENFGTWADDMWNELVNYLNLTKTEHDKEQERIKLENEQLKKEAEEKERKRLAEEKARKEKEESERKIREEKERKEKAEYELKLKKEREEKEKVENELRAKKQAEIEANNKRLAEEKKAKLAPDKDKLMDLSKLLYNLQMPGVQSVDAKQVIIDVKILLKKTCKFIDDKVTLM